MSKQSFNNFADFGKSWGLTPPTHKNSNNKIPRKEPLSGGTTVTKEPPEFFREDADYVAIAEQKIKLVGSPDRRNPAKLNFGKMSTSKIRNILAMINEIYNEVIFSNGDFSAQTAERIRYTKIRLVYESGRESDVKRFSDITGIIDALDFIGNSRKRFIRYARYMEALVAYHRFYGGDGL